MLLRQVAFGEERLPPAGEPRGTVRVVVDLDDVGDRAPQERSIVAHQQHGCVEAEDPSFESVEAIEVKIVGRLVEQEHVESRQQQRRQRRPGSLTARQRDHRLVEQPIGEAEFVPHLPQSGIEVGRAERQPTVERIRIAIVST